MLAKYVGDTAGDIVGNTVGDAVRAMPVNETTLDLVPALYK